MSMNTPKGVNPDVPKASNTSNVPDVPESAEVDTPEAPEIPEIPDGSGPDFTRRGAVFGARITLLLLTGWWPATAPRIAERLGYSVTYTRRVLSGLVKEGLLVEAIGAMGNSRRQVRVYAVAGYGFGEAALPAATLGVIFPKK